MIFNYILILIVSGFLTAISTLIIRKIAFSYNVVDQPDIDRKFHNSAIPLLGGLAIFIAYFIIVYFVRNDLLIGNLLPRHWLGFFIGACFLAIGGFLDDKYNLKPKQQIIWPILACLSIILGGVNIEKISSPFGGYVFLNQWQIFGFSLISALLIFLWLMGMMYTTKLLDGVDGLVTGVTAIGGLIIFLFTMSTKYYQPDIGLAALILAGCCLGFLFFNWYPAKIFLGESGSLLLGYILGVLAIISGGKIAIALLIMGLPILDLIWTIARRLYAKKNPFKFADRKHLHFRLLDSGLGARKTVLIYYLSSVIFGLSAVFLQSMGKLLALSILVLIMLLIVIGFSFLDKKSY
jgi:UDP-GlcNAc:undecaprenyl-phosphate/decaprenyl-phosphate GlcNAc-1-phosphate transferase